jgi:molybdopterin/thiamine biosynthesis adenylyltransferase
MDRFDRQRALFGDQGQRRLRDAHVTVIGGGGLGSVVVLELAYLGLGTIVIVDHDRLERTNRNRLVGAWHKHSDGRLKVEILEELVAAIDPSIRVTAIPARLQGPAARKAIAEADFLIGCLDSDGARLELNELCCRSGVPLIDAASDTFPGESGVVFGGRVCCAMDSTGCLVCLHVLDPTQIQANLASLEQAADAEAIYGLHQDALAEAGPSVIPVNGVVASLAVTELTVLVTGLREPHALLEYRGHQGVVLRSYDAGDPDCYYCNLREGARRGISTGWRPRQ